MRSMNRKNEITPEMIRIAFEGFVKNSSDTINTPPVRVVKAKSKKPDPLVLSPGGLTNMDTSSKVHHTKLTQAKMTVSNRKALTVQRLYGETYTGSVSHFQSSKVNLQQDHPDSSIHHVKVTFVHLPLELEADLLLAGCPKPLARNLRTILATCWISGPKIQFRAQLKRMKLREVTRLRELGSQKFHGSRHCLHDIIHYRRA
jgi:hypothetical protein